MYIVLFCSSTLDTGHFVQLHWTPGILFICMKHQSLWSYNFQNFVLVLKNCLIRMYKLVLKRFMTNTSTSFVLPTQKISLIQGSGWLFFRVLIRTLAQRFYDRYVRSLCLTKLSSTSLYYYYSNSIQPEWHIQLIQHSDWTILQYVYEHHTLMTVRLN